MTPSVSRFIPNPTPCGRTRREFLWRVGGGFAGLALLDLLGRDGYFASPPSPLAPRPPHFPAKARQHLLVEPWRRTAGEPFIDDEAHRIRTNIDDRHRGAESQPTLHGRSGHRGGLRRDRVAEGGCEGMIL